MGTFCISLCTTTLALLVDFWGRFNEIKTVGCGKNIHLLRCVHFSAVITLRKGRLKKETAKAFLRAQVPLLFATRAVNA